ncbi:hypothetical protein BSU04_01940 [Caballeronia sordidicola]|uniref:Uncharacterized protein n=1 Tax=Caballeronia sordidicola TaxID=196367 RepID=A0A226XAC4_CABSO|nr:hypothetical protein BSU04_01940 [Caballeronia sordidicola]
MFGGTKHFYTWEAGGFFKTYAPVFMKRRFRGLMPTLTS